MTEHIVNLAIGIDDDTIRRSIMEGAERSIINDLKADVLKTLFESRYYSNDPVSKDRFSGQVSISKDARLKDFAIELFKGFIREYKDEIIERAAKDIADSYKKSKAFKQKMDEVTE